RDLTVTGVQTCARPILLLCKRRSRPIVGRERALTAGQRHDEPPGLALAHQEVADRARGQVSVRPVMGDPDGVLSVSANAATVTRSEERRVGKECRSRLA